ncbi:hypothetical protein CXB51_018795 [Gossypium anomalum]|uniref:Zinc knuckle CX2CX4HX4C domain-containing protein n=1 Tax=Gossypium anomalum TaxID=47600 RepID=A0A8J5YSL5_9ROSI|nr:hypothetical protein CXB51_018795 [Gossypium anomalum]
MEEGLASLSLNEEEDDILQVHGDKGISMDVQQSPVSFIEAPIGRRSFTGPTGYGEFMEYDGSNLGKGIMNYLRVRVRIDVRRPLKRRKRILFNGNCTYVSFRYDRLSLFCFYCGRLGHNDSFCEAKMELGVEVADMGWDLSLRAQSRRVAAMNSMWLREEGDGETSGDGVNAFRNRSNGWSNLNKIARYEQPVDPVLRFSLERRKFLGHHVGNNSMLKQASIDIERDMEEGVLIGEEGKKRARGEMEGAIVLGKENSPTGRSRRLLEGNNFVSAAAKRQADRAQ